MKSARERAVQSGVGCVVRARVGAVGARVLGAGCVVACVVVVALPSCHLFSSAVACVDDAVCLPGETCVAGLCTAAPAGVDAGPGDGPRDAGFVDAGFADAGFADAGFADAGFPDAGFADAGFADAGVDVACPTLSGVEGQRANSGSCIYLFRPTEDLDFQQVVATCTGENAQPVVPLDNNETGIVARLIPDNTRSFVGLEDFANVGGSTTSRFLPLSFEVPPSLAGFFEPGQPVAPVSPAKANCIDADSDGGWADVDCAATRRGAICEVAQCGNNKRDGFNEECDGDDGGCRDDCTAPHCPHPAGTTVILVDGRCYVRLNDTFDNGAPETFTGAQSLCSTTVDPTAKLVLPRSLDENKALRALARKLVWVDVSDIVNDGTFVDSTGVAPAPSFFGTGDPINVVGQEDCIVARTTGTGQWKAVACSTSRGVVCETAQLP